MFFDFFFFLIWYKVVGWFGKVLWLYCYYFDFDKLQLCGWKVVEKEGVLFFVVWEKEKVWVLCMGLIGVDSLMDKLILIFVCGELLYYVGINIFLKVFYIEDVIQVGVYDVVVIGILFDGGMIYWFGIWFGLQGVCKIFVFYMFYNYEMGVDLCEQMMFCDVGDIFMILVNIEKIFD